MSLLVNIVQEDLEQRTLRQGLGRDHASSPPNTNIWHLSG